MPVFGLHSQASPRRRGPRRRLQPGGRSAGSSPGSTTGSCPFSEDGKTNTKQYDTTLLWVSLLYLNFYVFVFQFFSLLSAFPPLQNRKNLPVGTKFESDGPADPLTQTDGSPKSQPPSGWGSNKNSAFADETALQNLLQKLSSHSLEMHHTTGPGDSDSLSSYTSGW